MKSISETAAEPECQAASNAVQGRESPLEYARRQSLVLLRGLARTSRKAVRSMFEAQRATIAVSSAEPIRKGDLVRVRSWEEIQQTLDRRGYTKGCKFMKQMEQYCGRRRRVVGTIEKFFDEARCRTLNCRNLVLLDDIYCDGTVVGGCDRMCFLFWRTEWLEKVE